MEPETELELAPLDPAQAVADATRRFKRERKKQVKAARAKAEAEHAKSVAMSTVFHTHTIQVTQEEMDAEPELQPGMVKLIVWYDCETGFAARLVDLVLFMQVPGVWCVLWCSLVPGV